MVSGDTRGFGRFGHEPRGSEPDEEKSVATQADTHSADTATERHSID
jgi:hypothetical protein